MLKKLSLALGTCLLLSAPVSAHVTQPSDWVKIEKYKSTGNANFILERKYKKKWSEIVIDKGNRLLIDYLTHRIETITGYSLVVTELNILDDDLVFIYMVDTKGIMDYRIWIRYRKICARNPETKDFDTCLT